MESVADLPAEAAARAPRNAMRGSAHPAHQSSPISHHPPTRGLRRRRGSFRAGPVHQPLSAAAQPRAERPSGPRFSRSAGVAADCRCAGPSLAQHVDAGVARHPSARAPGAPPRRPDPLGCCSDAWQRAAGPRTRYLGGSVAGEIGSNPLPSRRSPACTDRARGGSFGGDPQP